MARQPGSHRVKLGWVNRIECRETDVNSLTHLCCTAPANGESKHLTGWLVVGLYCTPRPPVSPVRNADDIDPPNIIVLLLLLPAIQEGRAENNICTCIRGQENKKTCAFNPPRASMMLFSPWQGSWIYGHVHCTAKRSEEHTLAATTALLTELIRQPVTLGAGGVVITGGDHA